MSSYLLRSGSWSNLTTASDFDSNRQHASQSTRGARPPENKRTMAPTEYTIGWVCALPIELEAAVSVMDERFANVSFADLPSNPTDSKIYAFGRIGQHNIVAACLPAGQLATVQAAAVADQMAASFPSLRFGILVGVGSGVPNLYEDVDIWLGDVVISQPTSQSSGVKQWTLPTDGCCSLGPDNLNVPPNILLHALAKLRADDFLGETEVSQHLSILSQPKFASPGPEYDTLHVPGATVGCYERPMDIVHREPRDTTAPRLFFGNIASSDCVLNNGLTRDGYSQAFGRVLCFETEAVGLMNSFPSVVVRGICDYADSHRN